VTQGTAAVATHVVLVGLMGTGKTTTGRRLAAALRCRFVDNDEGLTARTGISAADLAASEGLDELHRIEADLLLEALAGPEPIVIAAAASVIDDQRCRSALDAPTVRVVWLRAPPAVAVDRASRSAHRPLGDDAAGLLARQERERHRRFEQIADLIVDTSVRPTAEVVEGLVGWLGSDASR
jgi:shikimate kinase